uniref:Dolichyl-diphosphooligosaccharide--protein glycosyltransferase subunit OST2 n=1 Tax=Cryptomonas curvata TaxID=233186 RepID=A0A7S0M8Q1_9CRYP
MSNDPSLISVLWRSYCANTDSLLKMIDCFLVYFLMVAAVQVVYCVVFGSYPFNAFLAGFMSSIGMFVLTVSLRSQVNPANSSDFENEGTNKPISKERAFAEWLVCTLVLHLTVINFIG